MAQPAQITICALTYRRPDGLKRLLRGLASQQFTGEPPTVKVLIVDNNPDASAKQLCERWKDRLDLSLSYVHEPRRGIPQARNTALEAAEPDTDWIAFIDDDEVPTPQWLDRLLWGQRTYNADVVAGAVVPHFPAPSPEWVRRGGFFDLARHPTGTRLRDAYTNNVMFRAELAKALDLRFDEAYGVGEDTHFFRRIDQAGYKIIWVDEALVLEWIDPNRINDRWLIERRYLHGLTEALIARDLSTNAGSMPGVLLAAARRGVVGGTMLALGRLVPHHVTLSAKRRIAYAIGLLEGLLNASRPEHTLPHGPLADTATPHDPGRAAAWTRGRLRALLRQLATGHEGSDDA